MGANRRKPYPDVARERIKATLILEKVQNHILDAAAYPMEATQMTGAKMLLAKVIPDLKAIEHSGPDGNAIPTKSEVTHVHVTRTDT